MTHPCAGHNCDHCYTCDVLGICCASVSLDRRVRLTAAGAQCSCDLAAAIRSEAGATAYLRQLIENEAAPRPPIRLLPAGSPVSTPSEGSPEQVPTDAGKERLYDVPPSPDRR